MLQNRLHLINETGNDHKNFKMINKSFNRLKKWWIFMTRKKMLILLAINILWAILTSLAVAWGTRFDWPDNVHIDYGFPFVWSTNTLSTFAEAVNIWAVDITALIIDIGLWLGIMLIIESVSLYFLSKE